MSYKSGFTTCSAYKLGLKSLILAKNVKRFSYLLRQIRFEDPKKLNFRNLACIYCNLSNIISKIDDKNGLINDIKQLITGCLPNF